MLLQKVVIFHDYNRELEYNCSIAQPLHKLISKYSHGIHMTSLT
jgi:hypothetical protein